MITAQIKNLFMICGDHGIFQLHGIGFVAQASLARLTHTQRYIFDSILSIFGKDVADNIFITATFADCKKPEVMEAVKEANTPHREVTR